MLGDGPLAWLSEVGAGRSLLWLVAGYLAVFVVTILIVVGMLAALPETYFRDDGQPPRLPRDGVMGSIVRVLRNAVGLVLIILGFLLALPAVPGQGVLTMLVGLMLVDFPGKRRFERKLVARPGVLEAMNRVRAWLRRPPLVL
jgi:hypothetical protein